MSLTIERHPHSAIDTLHFEAVEESLAHATAAPLSGLHLNLVVAALHLQAYLEARPCHRNARINQQPGTLPANSQ